MGSVGGDGVVEDVWGGGGERSSVVPKFDGGEGRGGDGAERVDWGRQKRRMGGYGGEGAAQEAELNLTGEGGGSSGDRHCGGGRRRGLGFQ
jgi:hypothetical protein